MLNISLSKIEDAKKNPALVAQTLIKGESGGAGRTFMKTFKSCIREYHETEIDLTTAVKKMNDTLWVSFKETPENNSRRQKFCRSFENYVREFDTLGLEIKCFQKNLDWEIIPNVKLTGHSPFLCSSSDTNVAYYLNETGKGWRDELKYPILQIYLAEKYFKCDVNKVKIGIFNLNEKKFELYTFEDFELDNAIEEAKTVFKNVLEAYNKYKI